MMQALRDPNVVLGALLAGLLLGSVEFIRPGWVIPGAAGATLVMLGIAGLSQHTLNTAGLGLTGCALVLVTADAWLRWGGFGACAGAVLLVLSLRILLEPRAHWTVAVMGGVLAMGMWRLLSFAVQAKANKMR